MTAATSESPIHTNVRLDRGDNGLRVIRLTNPAAHNAIDRLTRDELRAAAQAVAVDVESRVLVVTADGPIFCAGAELVETFDGAHTRRVEDVRADLRRIYDSFLCIRSLEIPTIAAVRGAAIGAGVNLVLSCDIRLAAPDATFGLIFTKLGLHPGGGCSYFLSRTLGPQRALRLLLDGDTLDARDALRHGFVDEITDDPESAAIALAQRWTQLNSDLVRGVKRSIRIALESGFDASLEFESWAQAASAQNSKLQAVVDRYRR